MMNHPNRNNTVANRHKLRVSPRTVGNGGCGNDSPRKFDRRQVLVKICWVALTVSSTFVATRMLFPVHDDPRSLSVSSSFLPSPRSPVPAPPVCSEEEMAVVKRLFPPGSTSKATKCPHATWWDDHMYEVFLQQASGVSLLAPSSSSNLGVRVGVSLGCNKGDDAIELLAKLSGNPNIVVKNFRDAFKSAAAALYDDTLLKRACPVHNLTMLDKYHPLWKKQQQQEQQLRSKIDSHSSSSTPSISTTRRNVQLLPPSTAHVFCVEAGTGTANLLQEALGKMDASWRDHFTITHAAMGAQDGKAFFPIVAPGTEYKGLCDQSESVEDCESVQMYTVDTYMNKIVQPKVMAGFAVGAGGERSVSVGSADESSSSSSFLIDFLSVDVEGFDWEVLGLGGADATLSRVKYLEFEYHAMGAWPKYNLSNVTVQLWEKHNFICYYSGVGELWRLTNCFQQYFDVHKWSNVACVNPRFDPVLAERMEATFQRQLLAVK